MPSPALGIGGLVVSKTQSLLKASAGLSEGWGVGGAGVGVGGTVQIWDRLLEGIISWAGS